jgi:putative salt-induced outer membrane protein YdiY
MGSATKTLMAIFPALMLAATTVRAQDATEKPERPWTNVADLGLVTTGGNASITTLSLADKFTYRWADSELVLEGKALNSVSRTRALSNPDGSVRVTETKETTAEEYSLIGRFRHELARSVFAYTNSGWQRNELAGIRNRYRAAVGVGYMLRREEQTKLALELGADWTSEEQVAGRARSFGGVQARLDYRRQVSANAVLDVDVELFESLKDTEDLRANLVAAITASVTRILAIKLALTLSYDRQPAEVVVEGDAPGVPPATFTFNTTDSKLSASLVINL